MPRHETAGESSGRYGAVDTWGVASPDAGSWCVMAVVEFSCPACEDTWFVPDPGRRREACRDCGSPLDVAPIEGVVA